MGSVLANRLRKVVPSQSVLDDLMQLALYGYDATFYEGAAQLVVLPETTEQTIAAVRACRDAGVPMVARGAATSLSGGPVPVRGGTVFSFTRMDRVLEIDYDNHRAIVQPGVVNQDLQKILAAKGFFYAPDPASQSVCTLGGNVGENSGGPHCLKYGVTANHVLGLTVVLPNGQLLRTGGRSFDAPGYDLTGLIVGSEGTFGLVTEITCRITPLPDAVVTMLAIFDSLNDASQSVSDIIADGIIPATLEMMDNPMIQAVEKHLHAGYPLDAEAVLIIELDGLKGSLDRQIRQVEEACGRNHVRSFRVAADEAERALLWKGRKGAFGAVTNIMPSKICTDISVPRSELPKVLAAVMEISKKWDIPITNVFHAGDGNLHPLILFDPRNQDQVRRAREVDQEITQLALTRGGVLTGEHGIGCGKRKYMAAMFSPAELRLMWRIKDSFDPEGLCNPGKVLPDKTDIPEETRPKLSAGAFDDIAPQFASRNADGRLQPADREAVCVLLAMAEREGKRIVLRGAGTKSGTTPGKAAVVDLSRLNRIVVHDYENLTITAECGVTLADLDAALAERGQMLAIRPRGAGRATLGGVIATADSGPHRLLYGAPRDLLLGVRAALPNGEIVRFGGSCVKDVAGYAVEKLFVGSHGTLGAILDVTLRTLPRPEAACTLALSLENPITGAPFYAELAASGLRPAAVELLNPAAAQSLGVASDGWSLLIGLEGFTADNEEMTRRLSEMVGRHNLGEMKRLDSNYTDLWNRVTDLAPDAPMLKISCLLSATTLVAAELDALDSQSPLRAAPGLGLISVSVAGNLEDYATRARKMATQHGGNAYWLAPVPEGARISQDEAAREISRKLKTAFDPKGILPSLGQGMSF